MQQLSPQDAQFLYMETENNYTHVSMLSVFDSSTSRSGKFNFEDFLDYVNSRLHVSPVFFRKLLRTPLDFDYPYWIDDDSFDLESHVLYSRLPDPGTWEQFTTHLSRYHSRPLDMHRPLWEMYVIDGLDAIDRFPKGSFAVCSKIHHAAIDGISGMRFFTAVSDIDALGTPAIDINVPPETAGSGPGLPGMVGNALINNVRSPLKFMDTVLRLAPSVLPLVLDRFSGGPGDAAGKVPDTRFNSDVAPQKNFDALSFDLEGMKSIRRSVKDAKINDAILAVVGGGIRRYLKSHDELPEDSLVAWVPINKRPAKGAKTEGNQISAMTTLLHTQEADPIERLKLITASTRDSKAARSGLSARLMTDLSQHIPGSTMALVSRFLLKGTAQSFSNLLVSNVPGPQVPLYLNGHQCIGQYGMAPLANGMGLFIATPSYNGKVYFSLTSTRDIIPDTGFFVECLEESFSELKQQAEKMIAGSSRSSRKKKPVRRRAK